jgi:hypothetical protein
MAGKVLMSCERNSLRSYPAWDSGEIIRKSRELSCIITLPFTAGYVNEFNRALAQNKESIYRLAHRDFD